MDWTMDWLIDRCIDRWINWLMDWWMIRLMDWRIERCIDGWMVQWIDGSIDGYIDQWIDQLNDGWMDRWINVSIHRWMDWSNEQKMIREGIQGTSNEKKEIEVGAVWGKWRKMRGNEGKEHYSQISCSCGIYLVDGAQSKCKRKCWFVFYAFLWTCRETAKLQEFKILCRAYAGALKGW